MAHAWMPGARRIRAEDDGGPLGGGAPRAVWLTLGNVSGAVSVQSAAQRLIGERRPCHLIWDPVTGEIAQLISVLRAARALGAADRLNWAPRRVRSEPAAVNSEGRVCVQVGVLATETEPFTSGPLLAAEALLSWLDSWGILRRWPAGQPAAQHPGTAVNPLSRSRAQWARGGHFGASQVPGCENIGPGAIDVHRLTGAHAVTVHARHLSQPLPQQRTEAGALAIPARSGLPRPSRSSGGVRRAVPLGENCL